jgi:hypothetical protein
VRARHTGTTGRHNRPQTFRTLDVYCKVLLLYQIDRDFQIASHLHVESEDSVRVKLGDGVASEKRNANRRGIGTEFRGHDLGRFKTAQKRASLNFLNNRVED